MPDPEAVYEASQEWLQWAENDAKAAELLEPRGGFENIVAFLAQQAVEKALKAICLYVQAPFMRTHDLAILLGLVSVEAPDFSAEWNSVAALTKYCFAGRYPDTGTSITAADAEAAAKLAREFVAAARAWIGDRHAASDQAPPDQFEAGGPPCGIMKP
jgi:HEPN domain-containing protein